MLVATQKSSAEYSSATNDELLVHPLFEDIKLYFEKNIEHCYVKKMNNCLFVYMFIIYIYIYIYKHYKHMYAQREREREREREKERERERRGKCKQ